MAQNGGGWDAADCSGQWVNGGGRISPTLGASSGDAQATEPGVQTRYGERHVTVIIAARIRDQVETGKLIAPLETLQLCSCTKRGG